MFGVPDPAGEIAAGARQDAAHVLEELLLVRGAVPGSKNGHVVVRPAIKVKAKKGAQ